MSGADEDLVSARVADEAAAWWARLRAAPGDSERTAFAAWRAADPAHDAAYGRLERAWAQGELLAQTRTGRQRTLGRASIFDRQPALAWAATASAAVLLVTGATFAVRNGSGVATATSEIVAYGSSTDRLRLIRLADGSRVTLDAASRVRADFSASRRLVWLDVGRARFDVAHDSARPFVVGANGVTVTARGTVFDVNVTAAGAHIVLLRGSVVVRPSAGNTGPTRLLAPGQQIDVGRQRPLATPEPAPPGGATWPDRMIALDNTPLGAAIAEFNRRNRVQIVLAARGFEERRMSGAFRTDDPGGFAAAVAAIFGFDVRNSENRLILTEKGNSPTFAK